MPTIDECVYDQEPAQIQLRKLRKDNKSLRKQVQEKEKIIVEATVMLERLRADLRC